MTPTIASSLPPWFSELAADVGVVVGLLLAVGAIWGFIKKGIPWWKARSRRNRAIDDTLLGRDPITDSITGKELIPALPSIGKRMETMEGTMLAVTTALSELTDQRETLNDHETRIKDLELARLERNLNKVENIKGLQVMDACLHADPATDPLDSYDEPPLDFGDLS